MIIDKNIIDLTQEERVILEEILNLLKSKKISVKQAQEILEGCKYKILDFIIT